MGDERNLKHTGLKIVAVLRFGGAVALWIIWNSPFVFLGSKGGTSASPLKKAIYYSETMYIIIHATVM